jgi:hypothetical protein
VNVPGGHTGGATPVPIPNTEVKPSKADATAAVRQWESRTLPGYNKGPLEKSSGPFLLDPKELLRVLSPIAARPRTPPVVGTPLLSLGENRVSARQGWAGEKSAAPRSASPAWSTA